MKDDQLDDLKQFIDSKISQSEQRILSGVATREDMQTIEQKIEDVDLKLDTISETLNEQLADHDTRITTLESSTT